MGFSASPGAGPVFEVGQDFIEDLDVFGDFEIEHAGEHVVSAVLQHVAERILRRDRTGGHDFKGNPGLGDVLHDLDSLGGIFAPIARDLLIRIL